MGVKAVTSLTVLQYFQNDTSLSHLLLRRNLQKGANKIKCELRMSFVSSKPVGLIGLKNVHNRAKTMPSSAMGHRRIKDKWRTL